MTLSFVRKDIPADEKLLYMGRPDHTEHFIAQRKIPGKYRIGQRRKKEWVLAYKLHQKKTAGENRRNKKGFSVVSIRELR
jgi:hypothetical protein